LWLIRLGKPKDLSQKSGNVARAVMYSNTTAMLPTKKESAYLHLPAYTAGVIFHIGTFLGLAFFVIFFFAAPALFGEYSLWKLLIVGVLAASVVCGCILLLERLISRKLRALSTLDDYISCLLTTLFQLFTGLYLIFGNDLGVYYYLLASVFLLYIPVGKLRHVVYFFAARYHLGFFYGWRNSWPPHQKK